MRVLDLGSGVGDVSLIAARLVGPTGSVLGVDKSEDAVAHARARADTAGCDWLSFESTDINDLDVDGAFDAVIGRFILLHLADPADMVRKARSFLADDGVVAFIEMDISSATAVPELELFGRCLSWIVGLYRRVGVEPDMGSQLYRTFRAAGLTPEMTGSCRVEAGPEMSVPEYLSDSIRSIASSLEQLGIAESAELEVETLGERLRKESLAGDHCFIFPRLIGAWARRDGQNAA
jgi:ubiquinone/menaquinone biosynthesis C-methylase UbiE